MPFPFASDLPRLLPLPKLRQALPPARWLSLGLAWCAGLLLPACSNTVSDSAYQKLFKANNLVAYLPPQGDPRNKSDWNKYGPGTVLRRKDYDYEQGASKLIGDALMAEELKDAQLPVGQIDHPTSSVFKPLDRATVSGYNVDANGGYTFDAAYKASVALHLQRDTEIKITFGETRLVNPLATSEMRKLVSDKAREIDAATRQNLRTGKSDIVWAAVYSKGLKFSFYQKTASGAEAKLVLTDQQIADLNAKGLHTENDGVSIDDVTFIAYRPLDGVAQLIPK